MRENTFFIEHLQYNIRLENKIFLSLGEILCKYFYSVLTINSSSAQGSGGDTIEIKFLHFVSEYNYHSMWIHKWPRFEDQSDCAGQ